MPIQSGAREVRSLHAHRALLRPTLRRLEWSDISRLGGLGWRNVQKIDRGRRSLQLGPGGRVGAVIDSHSESYPSVDSLPYTDSIRGEDYSANNTWWPVSKKMVLRATHLAMWWSKVLPLFSYRMANRAGLWFTPGTYEFATSPFVYELVRRMVAGSLELRHLEEPDCWVDELYTWLRRSEKWRRDPLSLHRFFGDVLSFGEITAFLWISPAVHLQAKPGWAPKGRWNGVLASARSTDVRAVRLPWGDTGHFLPFVCI